MPHDRPPIDRKEKPGGVQIGDVHGDIRDSIIAGGNITIQAKQLYIQVIKTDAPLTTEQRQELERLYLERVAAECRYLKTEGVDRIRAELTDVFVMLEAVESPRLQQAEADVAFLPERAEEMGLKERAASLFGRRRPEKEEAAPSPPPAPAPLSEALEAHDHLAILGEPGTGKTTTLQFVALCFAIPGWAKARLDLNETRIPVRIMLREYDGEKRLDRFLIQWLDRAYVPESLAQAWLDEGRLAVLLDGLDEVPTARRSTVTEAIERFAATPKGRGCRIILTSRIAGYREGRLLGTDFGQYTIRPFAGPEDAQPYVRGWLRALKPEATNYEATELLEAMQKQGGLRRALSNPLLLRLTVAVYVETNEIARNRAELYRRYVEDVTWKRAEKRKQACWGYSQIVQVLEIIAWSLQIEEKQTEAALVQAVEESESGVTDGRRLLRYLRERLGLLAIYGYERGNLVAFRHLTFQEYFVARRLKQAWERNSKRAWRFLRPRLHHPAWWEPILLLGGALDKKQAIDLVLHILEARSPYERELRRDLLLAAALLGEGVPVPDDVEEKIIDHLKQLSLAVSQKQHYRLVTFSEPLTWQTKTAQVSWKRRYQLVKFPLLQALFALPLRLDSRWAWLPLQERARHSLARLPVDQRCQVVDSFLDELDNRNADVRWAAVLVLGALGDPAVEGLIQVLENENKSKCMHEAAAEALGRIGDPRAVVPLIRVLQDGSWKLREGAAEAVMALGRIGDSEATSYLIGMLKSGDNRARKAAEEVLSVSGELVVDPYVLI